MNRNRWTALIVLLLVPLLVAGGFLWGTARVDSGLHGVQAAIVNNDEMVTINDQPMPLGRQLAAELVDSDRDQNFTWVMATEQKAREGLASGRYAAVVVIPKEFSAAATSFSKPPSEAVQATIKVETSPVVGISEAALGRSIADAASNALNRFLTGEYLKNIYLGFNDMHAQMLEMADGTAKLADGAGQLADGAQLSSSGADQLADGLGLAAAGSPQLRSGAAQSASGASALADGLAQASAGSGALRNGVQQAVDGGHQLADGARTLAGGTRAWAQGADRYATGVDTFADGAESYADGVHQYTSAINGILVPLRAALEQLPEWSGWLDDIEDTIGQITERAIELDARIQAAIDMIRDFIEQVLDLIGDIETVDADAAALARTPADTPACPTDLSEEACTAYTQGAEDAGKAWAGRAEALASDTHALAQRASALEDFARRILAVLDELSAASTQMVEWARGVQDELQRLIDSYPEGAPRTKAEVLALLDQFINAGTQLDQGGRALAEGADALADGARQLSAGARELARGTDALADGTIGLADGLEQLGVGVDAYTNGVDQAAAGASALASGLGQLSDGVDAYTGGVDQASAGASLLADGLWQLAGGAGELADGTRTLADGVAEGVDEIPTYDESERDRLSTVVASPVDTDGLDVLTRPNVAWVSLLLVSALWVGALATSALLRGPDRRAALSTASTGTLLARTLLPAVGIVAAQGLLLAILGAVALRLTVGEGFLLTGVLLAAGVAFALVNHALAAWLGNAGRIVSLVMVLVTAVTAATATAPGVFGALRGLSPLSPALDAVHAVSTTGQVAIPLFVIAGWMLVGLAACAASVARARTVRLADVLRTVG